MRSIETELHETLLDVANIHDYDEQALIVAEATAQYREAESLRTASTSTPAELHKGRLLDCVLGALERIAQADGVRTCTAFVEEPEGGSTLKSLGIRLSGVMGDMAILDDEDFNALFKESESEDDGMWSVEDIWGDELHRDDLYVPFGNQKKHRSQSLGY